MGLLSDVINNSLPQTSLAWAALILASVILYSVQLVVRRLYFHPLAKIPGPFLARTTYWYEFYQDIILGGMYVKNYAALHEIYGWYSSHFDARGPAPRYIIAGMRCMY